MVQDTATGFRATSAQPARAAMPGHAARSRSPEPAPPQAWFVAETSSGRLCLALNRGAVPPRHAADAALALWAIEPLLAALDATSSEPLHWRWQQEPPAPEPGLSLTTRGDGQVKLHLPWAWLQAQPGRGDAPDTPSWIQAFDWPLVPATIHAGQLRLSAEELDDLEPGGAVLWHTAGEGHWSGSLVCDASLSVLARVQLGDEAGANPLVPRLLRRAPAEPARPAARHEGHGRLCELRIALSGPVDARELVAALAGSDTASVTNRGRASVWQCAEGPHVQRRLAGGQLVPWGDAWALVIETLSD